MSSQIFLSRGVADHEPADDTSPPNDPPTNDSSDVLNWLHTVSTPDAGKAPTADQGANADQTPNVDVRDPLLPRAQPRRRLSQLLQGHWASHIPYLPSKTPTNESAEQATSILKTETALVSNKEGVDADNSKNNGLSADAKEEKDIQKSKKRLRFDSLSELPGLSRKKLTDIIYQSMTSPRGGHFRRKSLSMQLIEQDLDNNSAVSAAPPTRSGSKGGDEIMSGALPSQTGTAVDLVFSSPELDNRSFDNPELALKKSNSPYSFLTSTTSASCNSEPPSPLLPSTTAVHNYKIGKHAPYSTHHGSATSFPLSMEWMAAHLNDQSDSLVALPSLHPRSHSVPEIFMHTRHRKQKRASLPDGLLGSLLMFLDYDGYKALRMTWRSGSPGPDVPVPIVHRLPTETIQHVFEYLSPTDFNVARGSCESWYSASLNVKLLIMQLRRGGWWRAGQQDLKDMQIVPEVERLHAIQIVLSVRLAKECALVNQNKNQNRQLTLGPFAKVASVDYTLLHTKPEAQSPRNLLFTVSTCGRYVLVARDRKIFVYAFQSTTLEPYCKITCPRTVLAVAMDASSKQHVVAAVLEGRIGIISNVSDGVKASEAHPSNGDKLSTSKSTDAQSLNSEPPPEEDASNSDLLAFNTAFNASNLASNSEAGASRSSSHDRRLYAEPRQRPSSTDRNQPSLCSACGHRHYRTPKRGNSDSGRRSQGDGRAKPPGHEATFPFVVTSPRYMYRHLGSDDDPPRSVAVCPSRRCVAFGFSSGMEIHWIEVTTKQEHNRWFPLTAPADFLYFLPPGKNPGSANKLRLLSSIAPSDERPDLGRWRLARKATSGLSSMWGVPSNSTRYEAASSRALRQNARSSSSDRDYHRAVPLSDGYHHLFTDKSNLLWLGSDAPFDGQTKLSRLTLFIPPKRVAQPRQVNEKGESDPSKIPLPTSYTAATDLTRGVRVVVAYGSDLVFYTVPPDVLAQSFALPQQHDKNPERTVPKAPILRSTSFTSLLRTPSLNTDWLDWWPAPPDNWVLPPMKRHTFPLPVQGIHIGRIEEGVSDVSVSVGQDHQGEGEDSDIVIWAFSRIGEKAVAWAFVDGGDRGSVRISTSKVGAHGSMRVVESRFADEV